METSEQKPIKLHHLRHKQLNKQVCVEGFIKSSSAVRPQAISATFECRGCGNKKTIQQTDRMFKEPISCSCGIKKRFKMIDKEFTDVQRIVLEEAEETEEWSKQISVFLKGQLTAPEMEDRTKKGQKVKVIGTLKEEQIFLEDGTTSTRFDIHINADHLEII